MAELTIRHGQFDDADTIAAHNRAMAMETEDKPLDEAISRAGALAVLQDPLKGSYWIAEKDGRIVGQLLITFEWSDWRCGMFWWVQSVFVVPSERRRGVFRSLYHNVRLVAHDTPGVLGLRLYAMDHNQHAAEAYRSLGMAQTGYQVFEEEFPPRPPEE